MTATRKVGTVVAMATRKPRSKTAGSVSLTLEEMARAFVWLLGEHPSEEVREAANFAAQQEVKARFAAQRQRGRSGAWTQPELQVLVAQTIAGTAHLVSEGVLLAEYATEYAREHLATTCASPRSKRLRGLASVPDETIQNAVVAVSRKRGAPKSDKRFGSRGAALHALFQALGIASGGPDAAETLFKRKVGTYGPIRRVSPAKQAP